MRSWTLLLSAWIFFVLAAVGAVAWWAHEQDPTVKAQHAYEAARAQAIDATVEPVDVLLTVFWRLLPAGLVASLATVSLSCLAAWGWRRATVEVHPNRHGVLPVHRAHWEAGLHAADQSASLVGYHQTQIEAARNPVHKLPSDLRSFSPRYVNHNKPAPAQLAGPAQQAEPPAPLALPGRTDLAALTLRPTLNSILLALGPGGQQLTVSARELCHVALAGATGAGKSNLLRLLMAQLEAAGARVVLADPHFAPIDPDNGEDWRPIAAGLWQPPAVRPHEIADLLAWMDEELRERLERRRIGEHVGKPIFLAVDELPAITESVATAPEVLGRVVRQGRKVQLFAILSAQDFLAKSVKGDTGARENLLTCFYFGGDPYTGRALLNVKGNPDGDGNLGQGVAMLRSKATPEPQLVRVPLASNEAIRMLLPTGTEGTTTTRAYTTLASPSISKRDEGGSKGLEGARRGDFRVLKGTETEPPPVEGASIEGALSEEERRILTVLKATGSVNATVKAVFGVSGGSTYQQRATEVTALLLRFAPDAASGE